MSEITEEDYRQTISDALDVCWGDKIKVKALGRAQRLGLSLYNIQYMANSDTYLSGLIINANTNAEALLYFKLYTSIIELEQKQLQFKMRGKTRAYDACDRLITVMEKNIKERFNYENPVENRAEHFQALHADFKRVLGEVKDELESHRGIRGILDGIATILASLVIFYPLTYIYQKMNGINYTFFKTDSRCLLDGLEKQMGEIHRVAATEV
ncbi:MAG: hypothetical protein Q8M03_11710 [Legionella sp.]|nr:hypothetical protein [Legionella sp.]